ncbi:hypothetical protein TNCV_3751101 [Trichonephila clavipes]|uniref:Uncharacterized protein n=1 Tax=Trichonephila clavipes TaxID=2585209 RepID=A0A8X6UWM7_TRICX|nr:hypothetical protein TNCV_3751101 [Trichonephila clavipes]
MSLCVNSDQYVTRLQQFFLPAVQEMDPDNLWLEQDEATSPQLQGFNGCLKSSLPRMTDLPARGRILACTIT